jgi:hypothetical protein
MSYTENARVLELSINLKPWDKLLRRFVAFGHPTACVISLTAAKPTGMLYFALLNQTRDFQLLAKQQDIYIYRGVEYNGLLYCGTILTLSRQQST